MSASTATSTVTSTVTARPVHSGPRPCYRHPAHRWLAHCEDCTAWHLGRQMAAREAARTRAAATPTPVRSTGRRPASAVRCAA